MNYQRVLIYLDAIAANGNNDINNPACPHGAFWKSGTNPTGYLSYAEFIGGVVPGVHCSGNAVPIIDQSNLPGSASHSPFFLILTNPAGWCNKAQMPDGGPFVTDSGYQVTLADSSVVTGSAIIADLAQWLANGFPEH